MRKEQRHQQSFFDKLHIAALMAAPSLGRRSWYHTLLGKIIAAALISQSRRYSYRRVKRAAVRRLFSFAVVRQNMSVKLFPML